MKRTYILAVIFSILFVQAAYSQPKAIGLRTGIMGIEASYQHSIKSTQFLELDLGLDYGYNAIGNPGFKVTGIYNFTVARPAWTERGVWGLYAGPGISLGYVNDRVTYFEESRKIHPLDNGFMLSVTGQVGLEYTFWFPLQLSVDIRPYLGFHVNNGNVRKIMNDGMIISMNYGSKIGFYDNGLLGFIPTISARYRF